MPPIDAGSHLIDHLFEVGPAQGGEALTFREIEAWLACTGHQLNGWEAATLRRLSIAYLGEYQLASDPKRGPPFRPDIAKPKRDVIARRVLDAFERFERQDARRR